MIISTLWEIVKIPIFSIIELQNYSGYNPDRNRRPLRYSTPILKVLYFLFSQTLYQHRILFLAQNSSLGFNSKKYSFCTTWHIKDIMMNHDIRRQQEQSLSKSRFEYLRLGSLCQFCHFYHRTSLIDCHFITGFAIDKYRYVDKMIPYNQF